jgi:hypothetical protein
METHTNMQELFVKMALSAWDAQNNSLDKLLTSLTDEQLSKEIAPGRNTGVYLLGHLTAVSDGMLPLLGFGEKLYPQLENVFIRNPDKAELEKPPVTELKEFLKAVNKQLSEHIRATSATEWFNRHTTVSAEDFAKEPHRNKLNVIINRTNHLANHLGQMLLLK